MSEYLGIMKTRLFKYTENFTTKNENFQMKNPGSFHISAQNLDYGYLLELPRRGRSEQVDGAPSHIPAPAPSHISLHIKIPNAFP